MVKPLLFLTSKNLVLTVLIIKLIKRLETKRGLFLLFMSLSFISILILYLFNDSIFLGGDMLFHKARIEG